MRLVEAADSLHRNVALARFVRERFPPTREILDLRIQPLSVRSRQPNRGVDMDMVAVRVHHEDIFVPGKLFRERGPGRVHERLLIGSRLRAENDMREIARTARAHVGHPALGDLEARVGFVGSAPPRRTRARLPDPIGFFPKRPTVRSERLDLASAGQSR